MRRSVATKQKKRNIADPAVVGYMVHLGNEGNNEALDVKDASDKLAALGNVFRESFLFLSASAVGFRVSVN